MCDESGNNADEGWVKPKSNQIKLSPFRGSRWMLDWSSERHIGFEAWHYSLKHSKLHKLGEAGCDQALHHANPRRAWNHGGRAWHVLWNRSCRSCESQINPRLLTGPSRKRASPSAPQTSNCSLFTSHVFYISSSDWSAMEHSSTTPSKFTQVWFLEPGGPCYYQSVGARCRLDSGKFYPLSSSRTLFLLFTSSVQSRLRKHQTTEP